jgi:hypothetical protein
MREMKMRDILPWDWRWRSVRDVRTDLVSLLERELALHAPSAVDSAQHIAGNILAALAGMGRQEEQP